MHKNHLYIYKSLDDLIKDAYKYVAYSCDRIISFNYDTRISSIMGFYLSFLKIKSKYRTFLIRDIIPPHDSLFNKIIGANLDIKDYINDQLEDLLFYA